MSNPVGRPPKFKTPEELQKKFNSYIKTTDKDGTYKNISGFCYYIDTYRDYLVSLEGDKPEFSNTIKGIREYFARYTIEHAQKSEKNQALNIFLLKNYGYKDKTETDLNISGNIQIESVFNDIDEED